MSVTSDHDFPTSRILIKCIDKEFEDNTEKKSLDNAFVYVINGNLILSITQIEVDRKIGSFANITLHQLLHHQNISSDNNEIKSLLLTELEQFQEYYKGKYTNFDFNLLQPECDIDELVENNVDFFNICITALASLFVCKIHVFDILKNEETVIQDTELRNQNSPILFATKNQVLLCPVYKKKQVLKENSLHDLIKDRELVYNNIGRPHLITPHSGHSKELINSILLLSLHILLTFTTLLMKTILFAIKIL